MSPEGKNIQHQPDPLPRGTRKIADALSASTKFFRSPGQNGGGSSSGARCLLLEECRMGALTPREIEILRWVDFGKSNEDIAKILGIKLCTVKKHLESIFEKLHLENPTAASSCLRAISADPSVLSRGAAFRVEKAKVEAN